MKSTHSMAIQIIKEFDPFSKVQPLLRQKSVARTNGLSFLEIYEFLLVYNYYSIWVTLEMVFSSIQGKSYHTQKAETNSRLTEDSAQNKNIVRVLRIDRK